MRRTLFTLIALGLITASSAQTPLTTAVDFTVTTTEGHQFKLFDTLAGNKFVLIDFFYTTCGPCQLAAPKINSSYEFYGCNTSNVFFIGIDQGDTDAEVIAFHNTYGVHYPCVSGTQGGGDAVCSSYGITAYPTVILIAPDHAIIDNDIWPINSMTDINNVLTPAGCVPKTCPGLGIETGAAVAGIRAVYPNPANQKAFVCLSLNEDQEVSILLTDMSGRTISMLPATFPGAGEHTLSLDVADVPAGLYLVHVVAGNRSNDVRLLSITH